MIASARAPPIICNLILLEVVMDRKIIYTDKAPKAVGPYSQAVVAGGFVFCAGQLGFNPADGTVVPGGIRAETQQALTNLGKVLEAAGSSYAAVVKTTVYLADISEFAAMNEVYATFLGASAPARATVAVALPKGARVQIDAIALVQ
jgi:2-iminobutanoate/2-iminopropanoate deaminase